MTSGHIRFGETNSSLQDPEVPPQAQRMNGPGLKNHRRINMRFVITGAASGIGRSCAELLAAGEAIAGEHQMLLADRSEEHTSELQSLMRISYAVFCLKKKKKIRYNHSTHKNNSNINHTYQNNTTHP